MTNSTVRQIISDASPEQVFTPVEGLPSWASTERYDITTKSPAGATRAQEGEMMRNLLIDRFKVSGHIEHREQTVFDLVVARSDGRLGPQMKKSTVDCAHPDTTAPFSADPAQRCGVSMGPAGWATAGTTMDMLVLNMGTRPGGIVRNKTGLEGYYALTLQFAPANPGVASDLPDFGTAVQEQLGLKLVPTKDSVAVFVVDHIERPTEN